MLTVLIAYVIIHIVVRNTRENITTVKREWLSGGASPCQGEGRGFDSRLALFNINWFIRACALFFLFYILYLILFNY